MRKPQVSTFPPLLVPGLETCLPSLGYSNDSRELALLVAAPFLSQHAEGLKVLRVCPSLSSFTLALGVHLLKALTVSSRVSCSFREVNFLHFICLKICFIFNSVSACGYAHIHASDRDIRDV